MNFRKQKTGVAPAVHATPAAARATSTGTTYFDETSEFSGTLRLNQSVCIDGAIDGEIECDKTVTLGQTARVKATIEAESVVIEGEIHGDIHARSEITLHKGARVFGDMVTEGIVIEKGAKVEGRITIGPPDTPTGALPPGAAEKASGGGTPTVPSGSNP